MSEDILGHDHLDHERHHISGKHDTHVRGKREPAAHGQRREHRGPRYDPFGERPTHIGVWGSRPQQHTHHAHRHAHGAGHRHRKSAWSWKQWAIAACIALPLAYAFSSRFPAFSILLILLVLNTVVAYVKHATGNPPFDLEFLSVGAAALAALYGLGWGLVLAVIGSVAAELGHGHLSDFTWVKVVCVSITAIAAAILGPAPVMLFVAVSLGIAVQFFIMLSTGRTSLVMNAVRRVTNLGASAYMIFVIIPLIH